MPDFDSCSLSFAGGRKVAMPPFSKCRRHRRRFRKQAELNSAAAAVFGGSESSSANSAGFSSAGLAVFLSTGLADFSEPAVAADSLGVASLAAASALGENLVKNRVEFCDLS